MIALVLLGVLAATATHWLGLGGPWIYVVCAVVAAVAVHLVTRNRRDQA